MQSYLLDFTSLLLKCGVILYFVYYVNLVFDRNRKGPIPLPFIGNLIEYINEEKVKDKVEYLKNYYNKYGKLWITYLPNGKYFQLEKIINVTCENDLKHILKTNFLDYEKGDIQQNIFHDLLGNGIFNSDGCMWSEQRKISSHKFSQNNLKNYMLQIFIKHSNKFVNKIKRNNIYDFQLIANNYTLSSIYEIGLGINSFEIHNFEFGKNLDIAQNLIQNRFIDPFWKIKKEFNIGSEKIINDNIEKIDNNIYKIIEDRLKTNYETLPDILSQFMKVSKNKYYLRNTITNFLLAGRDTTASALTWCLYCLCKYPKHYKIIKQEIEDNIDVNDIENINLIMIKKLKYLNGFISEVLRLYTPVPVDTKICVNTNILPSGYVVKKNDRIIYHPLLMGNIEQNWKDVKNLDPYRWINEKHNQYKFPTFNAGKRICLGKDMAYLEITVFLIQIINKFDFELLLYKEMHQHMRITLKMHDGLMIKFK
jgi:cytochrome P450